MLFEIEAKDKIEALAYFWRTFFFKENNFLQFSRTFLREQRYMFVIKMFFRHWQLTFRQMMLKKGKI